MTAAVISIDSDTILNRVAQGDQGAVGECISRYGNMIWALARRVFNNNEDAEDAVQEVFLTIWKNAHRFDPRKASESTFITVIARRRLIDQLRTTYRRPKTEAIGEGDFPTVCSEPAQNARLDALQAIACLQKLKPEQKEMIWLNVCEGRSHGEIAILKNMPLGTVKTNLKRGLGRIRNMMTQSCTPADQYMGVC